LKPGEVWSCGLQGDTEPWLYVVIASDDDGVDLILLDSFDEPECDPGDEVSLSWDDIERNSGGRSSLSWRLVSG
jgi:hypothetical protein